MLQGFFFPSMSFFLGLGALVVLWVGSREVIRGRITLGQFVAFNSYLTMLSWPMIAFGWVTNMLQRGMASWKRMLEVLDTEPAIRDEKPPHSALRTQSQMFSADSAGSAVKEKLSLDPKLQPVVSVLANQRLREAVSGPNSTGPRPPVSLARTQRAASNRRSGQGPETSLAG